MSATLDTRCRSVLEGNPDDLLVEAKGVWLPRRMLQNVASSLDQWLTDNVPADATVGLIARNRPAHLGVLFGLLARRRAIAMLHAYQAPQGLADEMRRLKLGVVVGDVEDWSDFAREAARETGTLGLALDQNASSPLYCVVPAGDAEYAKASDDLAIAMLTSGTTGVPKRVPISYAMLEDATADAGVATQQAGTPFDAAPYIQIYPLGNISGLYGLITCVTQGQRVVLLEKFNIGEWVRAVETYRPTSFVSLPPAAIRMVVDADISPEALSSIPALRTGSAPLDPALQQQFEAHYNIPILVNYGATEFCGVVVNWTAEAHRRFAETKRGSVGQARPGVSLRITDLDSDAVLGIGQTGRLEVLVPRLSQDWVRTTDLAMIDADGFVFLKGRADSMIIRGGFKVSPDAVGDVLRAHDAIREVAVVGLPDPRLGEVPVAAIELEEGAARPADTELAGQVRDRLSAQAVPVRFEFVGSLPRTQSLKVDRGAVRRLLEERA